MSKTLAFCLPGSLERLTGGTLYDRRIVEGLRALGWTVEVIELSDRFPNPGAADLEAADAALAALPEGRITVIDGLAFGVLPGVARRHAARLPLIALVHHPLDLETGLTAERALALKASETAALTHAVGVIATSRLTAEDLPGYGVPPRLTAVVEPGTDRAPLARGALDGPPHLVSVGGISPRKGYDVLVEALSRIAVLDWRATIAGSLERDRTCVADLRRRIADAALEDRIRLAGELPREALDLLYDDADLFVLASRHEGFGMVLTEAMARGLPIVATRAGAIVETVPADAGLLVPPDDPGALAGALATLIEDEHVRRGFADGARRRRMELPGWDDQARRFAHALGVLTKGAR